MGFAGLCRSVHAGDGSLKIIYSDGIHSCMDDRWVRLTRISHEAKLASGR